MSVSLSDKRKAELQWNIQDKEDAIAIRKLKEERVIKGNLAPHAHVTELLAFKAEPDPNLQRQGQTIYRTAQS